MTKPDQPQIPAVPALEQTAPDAIELSQDELAGANGAGFMEDLIHAIQNR